MQLQNNKWAISHVFGRGWEESDITQRNNNNTEEENEKEVHAKFPTTIQEADALQGDWIREDMSILGLPVPQGMN